MKEEEKKDEWYLKKTLYRISVFKYHKRYYKDSGWKFYRKSYRIRFFS